MRAQAAEVVAVAAFVVVVAQLRGWQHGSVGNNSGSNQQ